MAANKAPVPASGSAGAGRSTYLLHGDYTDMPPDPDSTPDSSPPGRPHDISDDLDGPLTEEADESEDSVLEFADMNVQNRLWLKAVVPLLQLRSHETDPSGRVQFAFDQMYVAACERVSRILRCDLPASPD
jgi:hypothetical protein